MRRLHFSDEMERQFQIEYRCDTFQFIQDLMSHGFTHDEAWAELMENLNEIWEKFKKVGSWNRLHDWGYADNVPFEQ